MTLAINHPTRPARPAAAKLAAVICREINQAVEIERSDETERGSCESVKEASVEVEIPSDMIGVFMLDREEIFTGRVDGNYWSAIARKWKRDGRKLAVGFEVTDDN